VGTEDKLTMLEEFDGTASDRHGVIMAERISRTDGNTSSTLAVDLAQPAQIVSVRERRVEGFDEEGVVAEALAKARNAKRGTQYTVQEKEGEDSDYADRVLISNADEPKEIEVQIRHFDTEVIAEISPKKGKPGEFKGQRDANDLAEDIETAITKKATVDVGTKAKAILLLQIPAAIGKLARKQLQRKAFDRKGFKEVWVAPFHEEAFEVFPLLEHAQIETAAYHLWEKTEPRVWGDDQRFWYAAIDELRGL
jgi:hypothetical protein